ncbi:hypothetical protein AB6A40_003144 [Gnathostoma spinigerum]|uniref:Uncharacterized protein n=1 Tax=Gnathostoma spinigerum TaxID=75299 RepID=A0ABD6E9V4_9BILA
MYKPHNIQRDGHRQCREFSWSSNILHKTKTLLVMPRMRRVHFGTLVGYAIEGYFSSRRLRTNNRLLVSSSTDVRSRLAARKDVYDQFFSPTSAAQLASFFQVAPEHRLVSVGQFESHH